MLRSSPSESTSRDLLEVTTAGEAIGHSFRVHQSSPVGSVVSGFGGV